MRRGGPQRTTVAKEISPSVDADPSNAETPVRADAVIELLYRDASARDDRRSAIDQLADESLTELERARRRCPRCVAQIAVVAAASHRQRFRYAEASRILERAVEIETHWRSPQPHLNLMLADVYRSMGYRDGQRQQLIAAATGYLDTVDLDGARRALDLYAAAGLTDDDLLLLRDIVTAWALVAERGGIILSTEAYRLPTFRWVYGDLSTTLDAEFIDRQRRLISESIEKVRIVINGFGPDMSASLHDTIPVTSGPRSTTQRMVEALVVRPITPDSFLPVNDLASLQTILLDVYRTPLWDGAAEYGYTPSSEAGPSFTSLRGVEHKFAKGGGPLIDEKLWIFASADSRDSNRTAVGGRHNDEEWREFVGRLTYALGSATTVALNGTRSDSIELNVGASPSRAQSAQQDARWDRSSILFVTDVVFGSSGAGRLTAYRAHQRWSRDARSSVLPTLGEDGVWQDNVNTRWDTVSNRATIDGMTVVSSGSVFATFRGGGQFDRWHDTKNRLSDFDVLAIDGANIDEPSRVSPSAARSVRELWRSGEGEALRTAGVAWLYNEVEHKSFLMWTLLQYERWYGKGAEARLTANRTAPTLLPATVVPATGAIDWGTFAYQLGGRWRHGSGLTSSATISRIPSALTSAIVSFGQLDADDFVRTASADETLLVGSGIDPLHPDVTSNLVDPTLRPEVTDSVAARVQYAFSTITITFDGQLRRTRDVMELRPLLRDARGAVRTALASDYSLQERIGTAGVYFVGPEIGTFTGGALLTNGDRERRLASATLSASWKPHPLKLDISGTVRRHRWRIGPEYRLFDDPTGTPQQIDAAGLVGGDTEEDVAETFYGDGSDVRAVSYAAARWNGAAEATYELNPGNFTITVAANLRVREGDVRPAYTTTLARDGRILRVRAPGPVDRYPALRELNASLRISRPIGVLTNTIELWTELRGTNLLDDRSAVRRIHDLRSPRAGALEETRFPRAFEVLAGVRW
jgi:hypothetical protein